MCVCLECVPQERLLLLFFMFNCCGFWLISMVGENGEINNFLALISSRISLATGNYRAHHLFSCPWQGVGNTFAKWGDCSNETFQHSRDRLFLDTSTSPLQTLQRGLWCVTWHGWVCSGKELTDTHTHRDEHPTHTHTSKSIHTNAKRKNANVLH